MIVTLADITFEGRIELDAGNCPVRVFQEKSPHTDDSTLIEVPSEKVLFVGDVIGVEYPTWKKDPVKCGLLADIVEALDARVCVGSHWEPLTKREVVEDLRWNANVIE